MHTTFFKRAIAAALSLTLLGTLSACGDKGLTEQDAEIYVKGHLDAAYLGSYDKDYIDLVEDMTESDAKEMHEQNVSDEADILLTSLTIDEPSDELKQRAVDFVREVYSHSQYKVGSASKTKDGDFVIEVTVSPIEILPLLTDEAFMDALEESGYIEAETEEELAAADIQLGMLLLDQLEELLPQLSYGKDQ